MTSGIQLKIFATVFHVFIAGKYLESVNKYTYMYFFRSVYFFPYVNCTTKQPMIIKDYLKHGKNHLLVQRRKIMVSSQHNFVLIPFPLYLS